MKIEECKECYLSEHQRFILKEIFKTDIKLNAFLTGGTCLAVFYLNHRKSKDLDIFFTKDISLFHYIHKFRKLSSLALVEASGFCSYESGSTKIDFVYDPLNIPNNFNYVKIDDVEIRLDTIDNIAKNKLKTLITRNEIRDLFDFGVLFTNYYTLSDFQKIYIKAFEQNDIYEDIMYLLGIFNTAVDKLIKNKEELLLKKSTNFNQVLEQLDETYKKLSTQLIEINNIKFHTNTYKDPTL